jgi:hypothetical protein
VFISFLSGCFIIWRQGKHAGGEIDVAVIELNRKAAA